MQKINKQVKPVFDTYPTSIKHKLLSLRKLIIDVASEHSDIGAIEETLKWGQPSYLTQHGSTIRIGWADSRPIQFMMYFHCKTSLVDTFKELYGDRLSFEGNRAIVFAENDKIPITQLKHCILLSLNYHRIKHLPLLGA